MSSTELATRVLSSAYYLMAELRSQEAMSYPLTEALSHLMSGSTIRTKSRGIVGLLEGSPAGSSPVRCGSVGGDKFCGRFTIEVGD